MVMQGQNPIYNFNSAFVEKKHNPIASYIYQPASTVRHLCRQVYSITLLFITTVNQKKKFVKATNNATLGATSKPSDTQRHCKKLMSTQTSILSTLELATFYPTHWNTLQPPIFYPVSAGSVTFHHSTIHNLLLLTQTPVLRSTIFFLGQEHAF